MESNCCSTPRLTVERREVVSPQNDDLHGGALYKYRTTCESCRTASRWMWESEKKKKENDSEPS